LGPDARDCKQKLFDAGAANSGTYDLGQYVFPRDCALEAMRAQGRFSFFVNRACGK
jgi:hypothetical protein